VRGIITSADLRGSYLSIGLKVKKGTDPEAPGSIPGPTSFSEK
jgi:hypothetical protein